MRDSDQAEVSLEMLLGLRAPEEQQSCSCTRCGPGGKQCKPGTLGGEPRNSRQKQPRLGEGGDANQVTDLCTGVKGQVKRLPSGGA